MLMSYLTSPSQPFTIQEFSAGHLYQALSNEYCAADEVAQQERAQYLFGYLRTLNALTIVTEYEYTDHDYLDDYATYYARCFRSYERRCKRLHFFAAPLSQETFLAALTGNSLSAEEVQLQEVYLGFIVARPLPDAIVGRTILTPPPNNNGGRHYTCTLDYAANLFGLELKVRSLAFQEQDTVLAACATVALWCCFNKTRELFGTMSRCGRNADDCWRCRN